MESIKDRINTLIGFLKLSKNEFAREIGTSSAMISKITTKEINFGIDIYQKIISRYTDLNMQWLLLGDGDMWRGERENKTMKGKSTPNRSDNKSVQERSLTTKQMRTIYRNRDKATEQIETSPEFSHIFKSIGEFVVFQDMSSMISEVHLNKFYDILYDESTYLNGDKFDYSGYVNDLGKELNRLKFIEQPISELVQCIMKFYKSFNKIDPEKIIENNLNDDYV